MAAYRLATDAEVTEAEMPRALVELQTRSNALGRQEEHSFDFRDEPVPTDAALAVGPAGPGEVKRLGGAPVVVELAADGASVFVAAPAEGRESALAPFGDRTRSTAAGGRHEGQPG